VRGYPKPARVEIAKALDRLQDPLGQPHQHARFGIRKLVKNYFEVPVDLDLRLIFKVEPDSIIFVFPGSHDEVR
jgi:mRNA-degrading endonuclease YafQ of YafQ-DinJ toxin-antitoxin module